ncbi:hypothetical protein [Pseudomonas lurida]|uniref:hypothetical protein n=1 Tax=Pseudomonas lurida TaxID=244566 RepID=UPI001783394F|nr:hypothetical protein [Pseudomonas lurida]MBD8671609.1 hypothetical protein [Pseudomonas lurida]
MKQTRITSKPDGDSPLLEVEAVATRKEAYFGSEATSKTPYDEVKITVTTATLSSVHTFSGTIGLDGWAKSPDIAKLLPLPLQEEERFGQAVRDLMIAMVKVHVGDVKALGDRLPISLEKGHLHLNSFQSVSE